jgi:peptidoglycan/xylan/chitin deacetylase (PgdA/CDA1 family)
MNTASFPHGIMFHHFWDHRHPAGQGAIGADDLVRLLRYLGPARILKAEDWLERAVAGRLEPHHLCLTFDDALLCQYDVALPVLDDFGLTAFWFIYSSVFEGQLRKMEVYRYLRTVAYPTVDDFYAHFEEVLGGSRYGDMAAQATAGFDPRRYLAEFPFYTDADRRFRFLRDRVLGHDPFEEIMDILVERAGLQAERLRHLLWMEDAHLKGLDDRGHVLGLHSYTHFTTLGEMSYAEQQREYLTNRRHLIAVTGHVPRAMAHPCNSYNQDTVAILDELGVEIGFRSNMVGAQGSRFELPRQDHALVMAEMEDR